MHYVLDLVSKVLEALQDLHTRGFVHCNLQAEQVCCIRRHPSSTSSTFHLYPHLRVRMAQVHFGVDGNIVLLDLTQTRRSH